MKSHHRFETRVLHSGSPDDIVNHSRAVPLYRTSSYLFRDTAHAADLFSLRQPGNIYSRIMNPTQNVLEERIADLEGGGGALALASGTSAVFYSIINICRSGDEIVSLNNLYGGTYTMFQTILPQFGITVRFVSPDDEEDIEQAINEKTRILYGETIGNPALRVADIGKLSSIAKKHHIPLVIDSTFTTPYLMRPLEHGADIVIHSLTKWIGGHGTGIGGIVVDGGTFDWTDEKFSLFNEPDESYHGMRFSRDLGDLSSLAFILRMRLVALRNLGACISPDNAWMFLQGIETLPLRMERHSENAMKVAEYLNAHDGVEWVLYPGLPGDPSHEVAVRYMTRGFGGMVVFGIKGGYDRAVQFIDSVPLFSHLANVGDAKSLVLHPASTSHSQMTEEEQKVCGLTPDLIRLSVGIEHIDDILDALEKGLRSTRK